MALTTNNPTVDLFKRAFEELGYTFECFTLNGKAYTRFISPNGGTWLTRDARISYPFLNSTCQHISSSKTLSYELCAKNEIRIPKSISFNNINEHRNELGGLLALGPVVVKPNDSSLSWGVTLNIRSREALEAAYDEAKKFSEIVIAQEQVYGQEVRFAVVDGVLKAALLRETPRVIGDGVSTLRALIDAENNVRQALDLRFANYPMLDEKIIDFERFDFTGVPAKDEIVELNQSAMIRGGASMYNVIDTIHESYKRVAERAARALGAQFIVVDMMIEDLAAPATEQNYAFIEFNGAPVISLFYSCRGGQQYDAISELVPRIHKLLQGRSI